MKSKYVFPLLILLVFSLTATTAVNGDTESKMEILQTSQSRLTQDQGNIWFEENAYVHINPEGHVWTDVNLRGNAIGFDQLEIDQIIPSSVLEIFSWASMHTYPGNHPEERNMQISFTFRTNQPDVAEAAAVAIINALGSQILIQSLNFEGSNGYDNNVGNGFEGFTDVWYSGHVDWTNMQQVINNSIPRSYGGLSATIDANEAVNLNFQVWTNGNDLVADIGINFSEFVDSAEGGHHFSLAELLHVSQFSVADYTNQLSISVWLPSVDNLALSLGNSSNSYVEIQTWEPEEPHQDYSNTNVYIQLQDDASYADITLDFDYEFVHWSWRNRDNLNWDIDRRGYSRIHLEAFGRERSAPTFDLLTNQTIFGEVLDVSFRLDSQTMIMPGQHNIYLDVTFPSGYDYSSANATANLIADSLETLGLDFVEHWNYTTWGDGSQTNWYHANQTEILVDGMTYAGFLTDRAQFESIISNSYVYQSSAMFGQTDLSNIDQYSWWMYDEFLGRSSSVAMSINPYSWANTDLVTDLVQDANSVTSVDLLDPYLLGWNGVMPWNEDSESFQIWFNSYFVGEWEGISYVPETNNGYAWDSGRWFNDYDNSFTYNVRVYDADPRLQDYNNGNPIDLGPMDDITVTYDSYFFGDGVDLEAPYIQNLWYEDVDYGPSYELSDYPDYRRIWNSDGIFEGQQKMALEIRESSSQYFNGTHWLDRFPSSGIQNATGYFFRSDAPIDHPIFTQDLEFTHNSSWVLDELNHQIWDADLDTSNLPDGEWQLWAETFDNNDNYADTSAGIFTIDNYDETFSEAVIIWNAGSPQEGEGVANIVDFEFTVQDDAGIYAAIAWNNLGGYFVEPYDTWTNASGIFSSYVFTVDILAQGIPENAPFTITIEVLDMDGHWSYQEVSVFVDNVKSGDPPAVNLVTPIDGTVVNNTLTEKLLFSVEVVDDLGIETVDLLITGQEDREFSMFYNDDTGLYEYEATIEFWDLGSYDWNVEVTDIDENTHIVEAETSASFQLIGNDNEGGDDTPPTIILSNLNDGDEVSGVVVIEVEVTDDTHVSQVSLTGPDQVENEMSDEGSDIYSGSWDSASVADGEYDLTVEARDNDGNTAELTFSLVASNGRTASAPQIGLPGFQLYLALAAALVMVPITRRRK